MFRRILTAICWLGALNFVALWIISAAIGDAWYGIVEDGHYYLAKHATHRQPLEVTPEVFALSLWHVKSQFVTVPLAMLAALLLTILSQRTGAKFQAEVPPHSH
jgi:hypothetical protein